jgi:hypothetical protein
VGAPFPRIRADFIGKFRKCDKQTMNVPKK